jgi:hypothetical protein
MSAVPNSGPFDQAALTGSAITGVATIRTGVNTYFATACFFWARIARISASIR